MDTMKKPEDMTSSELANALKSGTIGGDKPAKTTAKVADVKPKTAKPAASKSVAVKVKIKGKTVVGHALKSDLKKTTKKPAPKAKKPARKFGVASVITVEKLSALLKKKPHTAAELAKIFKRSPIAVKRQVEKISGVKTTLRAANGSIGRRPNVYSLA